MDNVAVTEAYDAILMLSDGEYFLGKGIGVRGRSEGELCFNTGMSGYQETITDPSYAQQIIVFTFPHIGNVGTTACDNESNKIACKGLVIREEITPASNFRSQQSFHEWLEENNVVGISGVDTRRLTRSIRTKGPRHAVILSLNKEDSISLKELHASVDSKPGLLGRELTGEVTTSSTYEFNEHSFSLGQQEYKKQTNGIYHVVAIDYGVKRSILRCLVDVGCRVTVVPSTVSFEEIMSYQPDGVFLSNGPGDPFATAPIAVPTIQSLLDQKVPIFGICLGHQLLCLSCGLKTEKMHKGHRGANQPVQDMLTRKVYITSQNHGFCVSRECLPENVEITHLSLFDNTVEGICLKDRPAFSVQYHPESSPGPHESRYLFQNFVKMIERNRK